MYIFQHIGFLFFISDLSSDDSRKNIRTNQKLPILYEDMARLLDDFAGMAFLFENYGI